MHNLACKGGRYISCKSFLLITRKLQRTDVILICGQHFHQVLEFKSRRNYTKEGHQETLGSNLPSSERRLTDMKFVQTSAVQWLLGLRAEPKTFAGILYTIQLQSPTIECFELEGTFKAHVVQPTYNDQGQLQLEQVLRAPSRPLNVSRVRASTTSLGNLFQCFTTLIVIFFSYILSKSPIF